MIFQNNVPSEIKIRNFGQPKCWWLGFGDKGRIKNDDPSGYKFDNTHFDDDLMREALENMKDGEYSNLPWKKNNCQDWAERLREEYERLKKLKKRKGECNL